MKIFQSFNIFLICFSVLQPLLSKGPVKVTQTMGLRIKKERLAFLRLPIPGGSDSKESACNVGGLGLIPRLGRSPGGEHGNPLHYSCPENPHGQRSLAVYPMGSQRVWHDWATFQFTFISPPPPFFIDFYSTDICWSSYGGSRWVPLNFNWENALTARISSCHNRPGGRCLWLCVECIMGSSVTAQLAFIHF